MSAPDAVVVGAGPNGFAAAITLAQAGRSVVLYEAGDTPGGGTRSAALTLPGFLHDVCSAVYPFASVSPFFRSLDLDRHGLRWVLPENPLAHAIDGVRGIVVQRSVAATAAGLGRDGAAYQRLFGPLVDGFDDLADAVLHPFLSPPRHPFALGRFGLRGLRSAAGIASSRFSDEPAAALFAGLAAHAILPLDRAMTASFGLLLGAAAHATGWPLVAGGAQRIADALAACLLAAGGEIQTGHRVDDLGALPPARAVLLDLTPRQVVRVAADRLSEKTRRRLEGFRYGPGVFKVDYALAEAIPWQAPECRTAGTVHAGGTLDEVAASEAAAARGEHAERPFLLVVQPSLCDPTRAPAGRHTAWVYCHVPHRSDRNMTPAIEAQLERFAPGFRDVVLARATHGPAALERWNENYVGGDIAGGAHDGLQLLARPWPSAHPYELGDGLYMCSSSTPPGAGVHGMCGHLAARAALRGPLR